MTTLHDYTLLEEVISLCSTCDRQIAAALIARGQKMYLRKRCPDHGVHEELFEENLSWHAKKRLFDRPGSASNVETSFNKGCPHDCGLCPDHDQHSCISLIEVTQACDLACPVCFASSGSGEHLSIEDIEQRMDFLLEAEGGTGEILQISGGEPTTHPRIIDILRLAKKKNFRYLMLNTNGVRIASDPAFVEQLKEFRGGFELYLQFDSLNGDRLAAIRGVNLLDMKMRAINALSEAKIATTLVTTVVAGVNEDELGALITFALKTPSVRGITFQPMAFFGRVPESDRAQRVTLSGTIDRIAEQCPNILSQNDFVPLPCNVERVGLTYLYKTRHGFIPLTRHKKFKEYAPLISNTFIFTIEDTLKKTGKAIFDAPSCCAPLDFLKDFASFVPKEFLGWDREKRMAYIDENTFRITVNSFVDRYNFDLKSMRKECVHLVTGDKRRIPLSAYNMLHREAH